MGEPPSSRLLHANRDREPGGDAVRWALLVVGLAGTAAADPVWDQRAKAVTWSLDPRKTTFDYVMDVAGYDVELVHHAGDWLDLDIRILRGKQLVHQWRATPETPLVVQGDTLYYVVHHPIASGAGVVAIDLATGKQRWQTAVVGIGPQSHSKYRNQVALEVRGEIVIVQGAESHGRYVELLDRKTGKTLANDPRK
jgi:outer membrane protein assembly factor BamB